MNNFKLNTIEEAVSDFREGKFVIVVDDEDRENEGDLICAAEKITPEMVNFMLKYARGVLCAPITIGRAQQLELRQPQARKREAGLKIRFRPGKGIGHIGAHFSGGAQLGDAALVLSGSKQDEANAATPGKSAAEKPKEEHAPETAGDSGMGDSGTLPPPDLSAAVQRGKKK